MSKIWMGGSLYFYMTGLVIIEENCSFTEDALQLLDANGARQQCAKVHHSLSIPPQPRPNVRPPHIRSGGESAAVNEDQEEENK